MRATQDSPLRPRLKKTGLVPVFFNLCCKCEKHFSGSSASELRLATNWSHPELDIALLTSKISEV